MRRTFGLTVLALLLLSSWGKAADMTVTWEPIGIGGGGGVFTPSVSPHDEKLMFVCCDMGGWYRSTDGGENWRMCDGSQIRKVIFPAVFHPTDPNIIYVGGRGGLRASTDRGVTYRTVAGQWSPADPDMPTALAVDPNHPEYMLAGFKTWLGQPGSFLVVSRDAGKTWAVHPKWTFRDRDIVKIVIDPRPLDNRVILVATGNGFFRAEDAGENFQQRTQGLPGSRIVGCVAAWTPDKTGSVIFVTLPGRITNGQYVGGVYRSTDEGNSWQAVINGLDTAQANNRVPQYAMLTMSPTNTRIVYVASQGTDSNNPERCSTVYRTADGGDSWTRTLYGVPSWPQCNSDPDWMTVEMSWWWGGTAIGFGCNPNNPDEVYFTDAGRGIRTKDGGKHWVPLSTHKVGPDSWSGHGLEVTTCYEYYFDPNDRNRTYIAYTDFGMTRSLDRGQTWIYAARQVPWGNTCYEMALDPDRPGVVYGAWSTSHDLIHWKMINRGVRPGFGRGGVTKSTDYAEKWTVMGRDTLPQAPATTILLDPTSPKDSRTLYVGILGQGVYKSTDDGETWTLKNKGLGTPQNMNVWRLDRHRDGTLLCGISIQYENGKPVPGALYRSTDGADSWERVNKTQPMDYIWGVKMDPRDSKVIYVSCFDVPPANFPAMGTSVPWPKSQGGGLFKSTDGGTTWKKVLDQPYCWDVTFDPKNADIVYAGTFVGGLFRSTDAGATWSHLDGLPFVCAHRATVDPTDGSVIYVTTFGGGVWKGTMK